MTEPARRPLSTPSAGSFFYTLNHLRAAAFIKALGVRWLTYPFFKQLNNLNCLKADAFIKALGFRRYVL